MVFPFNFGGLRLPVSLDLPDSDDLSDDELAEMLEDEALAGRVAAARILAMRGDSRAYEVLVDALESKYLRYPALEGLRILADPRSLEPVRAVMNRAFVGVFERTQAAGVLAAIGVPEGISYIMERLARRKRDDDRGLAVELAAGLKIFEAIPELENMAADRNDIFRGAALKALAKMNPGSYESMLCDIALDEDDDPDVRADVIEALALIKSEKSRKVLENISASSNAELAAIASELLEEY